MHRPSLFRRLVSGALIASATFLSPFGVLSVHASTSIVIGEVAWAGSSLSTADEWFELWNLGDVDAPVGGYMLVGASTNPLILPPDAVIPAHGAYLISNYDASNTKSVLAAAPQYVTTDVALSNSALQIVLQDPSGTEIDRAGTGGAPPAGQSGVTKDSMIRSGDTWTTATTNSGMKDGTLDLGTPGFCDECVVEVPAPEITPVAPPLPEPESLPVTATSTDQVTGDGLQVTENATSTDTPYSSDTTQTTTSSTFDVIAITTDIATTSTDIVPLNEAETTSTEQIIETVADATSSVATTTAETTTETVELPRYDLLRLNEIEPNPNEGAEWIEITSIEPAISVPLAGIQLFDAVGHVLTVATGTVDSQTPFVHVSLSSSRLNNGGDIVTIKDPVGGVLDTYTYGETTSGVAWARSPDATGGWSKTPTPTPDASNIVSAPILTTTITTVATENIPSPSVSLPTTSVSQLAPPNIVSVLPVKKTATSSKPTTQLQTKPTAQKTPSVQTAISVPKPATTVKTTSQAKTAAKPKTSTVKKKTPTSSAPKTNTYTPLTFDMINSEIDHGIRVSLQGVVGSPSGLLTSHGFVLLSPDGRGLLVHVPTARKLPAFGDTLVVSGTLQFDDVGVPSIKLNSGDGWSTAKITIPSVAPRDADLFTPSAEDAWSLVSVSGTVLVIKNTTVTIMSDGADVDVAIRKVVGYRVSRLAVGDTIQATGLLNTSTDVPRIFPRTVDDILLVSHAEKKQAAATPTIPGWTPFGAAGLAVAGTEGAKHWRERRKRRTLEKILEKDINATV